MFEALFFFLYRFVFWPVVLLLLPVVALFVPKVKAGLKMRRELTGKNIKGRPRPRFSTQPLWIHASSGEFEYAKPVIREFKKRRPETPIVVTYFSPSYAKSIADFSGVDYCEPLPLDLPGPTHSFLKWMNPRALLVARTDLWPETLKQVKRRNVPSLLFSTTTRPFTGARGLLKPYARMIYRFLSTIFAVSETDRVNIGAFGEPRAEVRGDTRFDQVLYRLQNPKPIKISRLPNRPLILVAGSTWPEDEKELLPGVRPALKQNSLSLIIAPHEPSQEHIKNLKSFFHENEISCSLYSEIKDWQSSVLIVDTIGILAELYTIGDIAFVGGSFRRKVHSVMEPLAAGLQTLVGPRHTNNREALEFQTIDNPDSAVLMVEGRGEIERALQRFTQNIGDLEKNHARIRREVQKHTGATEQVLRWLENLSI